MNADEVLAGNIRALREEKGLTLGELERLSGVSKGYLSQLEGGKASNPSLDSLRKIAAALGVQISDLLGEERGEADGPADRLPRGLREFIAQAEASGQRLTAQDIAVLQALQYRQKRPRTAEDYAYLYSTLRRVIG
jgi:transcriptional regulator with XRE-family HTH domain